MLFLIRPSIQRLNPDIAEAHGVTVVLQEQGALFDDMIIHTAGGVGKQREIVLDHDAVLQDGDRCRRLQAAVRVALCGAEDDVIGLPFHGCAAGVDQGRRDAVDSTANVICELFLQVSIQNLQLVAALNIYAAVAAILAALLGHVRCAEFHVDVRVAVGVLGYDILVRDSHDAVLD